MKEVITRNSTHKTSTTPKITKIFTSNTFNTKNGIFSVVHRRGHDMLCPMSKLDEVSIARAEMVSAKRALEEATDRFRAAVHNFEVSVQSKWKDFSQSPQDIEEGARQPKGRIRELARLAFSNGAIGRGKFKDVHVTISRLAGEEISEATVRQTLYRMENDGELERYAGQWSRGPKLK
ncbi:MAG: hypothetical protein AB3N07_05100 [Ruegeria sp.]